jgi:hypothetical protein
MTAWKIVSARVVLRQPTVNLDAAATHDHTAVGDVRNSEVVDRRFALRNGWGVTDVRFPVVAWHAS